MSFSFVSPTIQNMALTVYDARRAPFSLHGLYKPQKTGLFRRMPSEFAETTSERIALLHTNTAGARLRFATDSRTIAVGAIYPPMVFPSSRSALMSGAGACCFDLYADGKHCGVLGTQELVQNGSVISFDIKDGRYESVFTFPERKTREITLCFPAFVNISEVFVGLDADAAVTEAHPYSNRLPVVFYGSSITQGACACRAGNSYPNILSRRFDFDYINLGFAGGCEAQEPMISYLCSLPMRLLVFDYDHNTPNAAHLRSTHLPALLRLRQAHPHIPFILLSKPNRHNGREEAYARMQVIAESYEVLRREFPAPVYFVSGQEIFTSLDEEMMTIDGTHPTDLGFYAMAEALSTAFAAALDR